MPVALPVSVTLLIAMLNVQLDNMIAALRPTSL